MNISYKAPWWAGQRIDPAQVTDEHLKLWEKQTRDAEAENREIRATAVQAHQQMREGAGRLYGTSSAIYRALYAVKIPPVPDFSAKWKVLLGKVEKARSDARHKREREEAKRSAAELRRQQRQEQAEAEARDKQRRRETALRAAATRRENIWTAAEVERERREYVEQTHQSD